MSEKVLEISLKDKFNDSDIYSLLKDFSEIAPNKNQLTPENPLSPTLLAYLSV